MMLFRSRGFTLIELMVVVAIVGIVMAAGVVAFTTVQRNSRDVRKQSDIRSLQKAFDSYQILNGDFGTVNEMAQEGFVTQELPTAGENQDYTITFDATGNVYCICGLVEDKRKGNAVSGGANGSCEFSNDELVTTHFCVTNDSSLSTFSQSAPGSSPQPSPSPSVAPSTSPSPSPVAGCTTPWGVQVPPNTYTDAPTCGGTYTYDSGPASCFATRRHRGFCTAGSVMNFSSCLSISQSACP